jgi:inner membrane protein YidH
VAVMAEREAVDATRRTRLANERTYLAWLRSALTTLAVAIGAGKIVPDLADVPSWPFEILGAGFAVFAVVLIAYGARRFILVEKALAEGLYVPLDAGVAIALAAIASVLGVVTLALVFVH